MEEPRPLIGGENRGLVIGFAREHHIVEEC